MPMFKRPGMGYNKGAALIYHRVYHQNQELARKQKYEDIACQKTQKIDIPEDCEAYQLFKKMPGSVPIYLKRDPREKSLPHMDKIKFVVPEKITVFNLKFMMRCRMLLQDDDKIIYLTVKNTFLLDLTRTLEDIYREHKSEDHFLHITYASYETLG